MLDPAEVADEADGDVLDGDALSTAAVDGAGLDDGAAERRSWWSGVWRRLTAPTKRRPADYAGRRLPRVVNDLLDGRGVQGAAHEAQVGEAVGLVVDHALGGGRADAQTPLGHLGGAVGEYAYRVWEAPRGEGGDEA